MNTIESTTNSKAIREYFDAPLSEIKDLSKEDRAELGALAAEELGKTIVMVKSE